MIDRYDRQITLFGKEGQGRIDSAHVVLFGCGGLGMHLVQQLAYLGVRTWTIVDSDVVDETNLNRLIGAYPDDVGSQKTTIAARMILAIQPDATITELAIEFDNTKLDDRISDALSQATVTLACFDRETPRLGATAACSAVGVPLIDVASEVIPQESELVYGGRIVIAHDGTGCLSCLDLLDGVELARERMNPDELKVHNRLYGIDQNHLGGSGPSVVTLNGVVASLAAMEAMALLTGLRVPVRQLTYRADKGTVTRDSTIGPSACKFCTSWRAARGHDSFDS